jgi:shikimate dehydrogenase
MVTLSAKTQLYISLSQSPSMYGSTVYNSLIRKYKIDALYIPRKAELSPEQAIHSIRALGVSGCSVSMPLKAAVVPLLDNLDSVAKSTRVVNTIVNRSGKLFGANTDCFGIENALGDRRFASAVVFGNGATAVSMVHAFRAKGVSNIYCSARDSSRADQFAEKMGIQRLGAGERIELFGNATPGGEASAELLARVGDSVRCVFDVNLRPEGTPLTDAARRKHLDVITGMEMYCFQVQAQFAIYFGITPTLEEIREALKSVNLI